MRKLSKGNEGAIDKKIELMIKVIIRTDSYLNSANTKSTILLSLSSALLVALSVNFKNITGMVIVDSDKAVLAVLAVLISLMIFLLITSIVFSLRGITPYIKPSTVSNTFSFVDISINFHELHLYKERFNSVSKLEYLNELISLNHNLSKALVAKYNKQITAITCIEATAYVLCFSVYMIIIANC
ncbi:hypothetical protein [Klebsiella pneumoniae]|uniref:hypothetical protein n=1 Tax=Klebsiella pneumoniae TaxID=573 RepID=UPI002406C8EB|nr:hypothetical protein [Klebsiella pneumoniae]MDG0667155.1 hypothetical protein [Klebsiella pneumoniae]